MTIITNLQKYYNNEGRALQMIRRIGQEMRKAIAGHETLLNEATSLIKEYVAFLK